MHVSSNTGTFSTLSVTPKKSADPYNPHMELGDTLSGYTVKRQIALSPITAIFYELEHEKTGAKHIHISHDDKDNTFGVSFKTVPEDSTGVAHILEHIVLNGSKKYPVRDPFFSMLKRSLSTFMNAFTASDWTMYPFSTQNKKDYYNLMSVYLDAVFFPNLNELSFKQEGYRLEIETSSDHSASSKLVYKGVVYNEMKGAMSSPREVLGRTLLSLLFPSTPYRHNSGGDPEVIPQLTHQQLKAFHHRYYHPSNAFFYTYGNLPLKEHLHFIHHTILKYFDRIDPETGVLPQARWQKPKIEKAFYPLAKSDDPKNKCQVCMAWLTADIKDAFEILALVLLSRILLGNSASPLRKALIDSGLGTALSDGTGFDSDYRDSLFSCGLKDVDVSSAGEIERIIFNVLRTLVEKGIDPQLIESAIHQLEFHRKEITHTPYPYGLKLLLTFSSSWFQGGDPIRILEFDNDLEKVRSAISKGGFFEDRIKRYFLDNPHRVLFTLAPDKAMAQRETDRVFLELDHIYTHLTDADLEKIKSDTQALIQLQNAPEDVSCLPTLEKEDISPKISCIAGTTPYVNVPVTHYEQPTSGIFYFDAAMGVGLLQKQYLSLVPFFCYTLPRIGTALRDYTEMVQLIDAYTGGIGLSSHAHTGFTQPDVCIPLISFNGKCLARNQGRMFTLIEELFCHYDFSDLVRLKNLFLEYRAGLESMIVPGGNRLAMSLASRNFSPKNALSENWHGIHQLKMVKEMGEDLTNDKLEALAYHLMMIGQTLFTQNNIKIALIGDERMLASSSSPVTAIVKGLKGLSAGDDGSDGFRTPAIDVGDFIPREGWSTSSAVSFVASAFKTIKMGHEDAPAMSVISRILRSMVVHREVREKGGAYGGYAVYNAEDGMFSFSSYRDPHVIATLEAYKKASSFIQAGEYTDEDVKEAILQVCSDLDKPDAPGSAARKAFLREILGLSDAMREHFKKQLLILNRDRVLRVAETHFKDIETQQAVAVISGEEKLNEVNSRLAAHPLKLFKI